MGTRRECRTREGGRKGVDYGLWTWDDCVVYTTCYKMNGLRTTMVDYIEGCTVLYCTSS